MNEVLLLVIGFILNNVLWMTFCAILLNSRRQPGERVMKINIPNPIPEKFRKPDPNPEKHEYVDLENNAPDLQDALKSVGIK